MSEVKYYHLSDTGLTEGKALGRLTVVLAADHDRITAERDALQLRLNVADQRNDDLASEALSQNKQFCTCGACPGGCVAAAKFR